MTLTLGLCLRRPARRALLSIFVAAAFFAGPLCQESKAMDPVTIGLLGPMLLPYAKSAGSWVMEGMFSTIPGWIKIGGDFVDIFKLPIGVFESTLLAPFGYFEDGLVDMFQGAIAPFDICFQFLCMFPRFCHIL